MRGCRPPWPTRSRRGAARVDQVADSRVRIVAETRGRPVERYAIRLEIWDGAAWRTVHLFDNAHGQHDAHRYRGDEKLPAESVPVRTVAEAIPMALRLLSEEWER